MTLVSIPLRRLLARARVRKSHSRSFLRGVKRRGVLGVADIAWCGDSGKNCRGAETMGGKSCRCHSCGRQREALHRRADRHDPEGSRGGPLGDRGAAAPWGVGEHVLPVEGQVRGMDVNEAKRLKALEDENRRLKKLVAQQALDNQILREALGKD